MSRTLSLVNVLLQRTSKQNVFRFRYKNPTCWYEITVSSLLMLIYLFKTPNFGGPLFFFLPNSINLRIGKEPQMFVLLQCLDFVQAV